jgi:hypothetical protein
VAGNNYLGLSGLAEELPRLEWSRDVWKNGHYSAEAKQVRREARQQLQLLGQLIAAGNEDDVLALISSL